MPIVRRTPFGSAFRSSIAIPSTSQSWQRSSMGSTAPQATTLSRSRHRKKCASRTRRRQRLQQDRRHVPTNARAGCTVPAGPAERPGGQRGQTLVIFALFLSVLLGAAALTVDYASWLKVRRDYQNGADAAALAGAQFLTRPIDGTKRQQARDAAWASLKTQLGLSGGFGTDGYLDTGVGSPRTDSGYRMWVSTPPLNAGLNPKYPGTRLVPRTPSSCGSRKTIRPISAASSARAVALSAPGRQRVRSPADGRSSRSERMARLQAVTQKISRSKAVRSST